MGSGKGMDWREASTVQESRVECIDRGFNMGREEV